MVYLLPFALQGLLMGVDEFYFHRRRHLRRWERWGHPVDTLTFVICLVFLLLFAPSPRALGLMGALGIVNCLVITKDEWEHRELCTGAENWLHAVLFMLHPILLGLATYLWWTRAGEFAGVVLGVVVASSLFLVYQILFWNVWRRD